MNFIIPKICPFCNKKLIEDISTYYLSIIACRECISGSIRNDGIGNFYKFYISYDKTEMHIHLATDNLKILINIKNNLTEIYDGFSTELLLTINSIPEINLSDKKDIIDKINFLATFI